MRAGSAVREGARRKRSFVREGERRKRLSVAEGAKGKTVRDRRFGGGKLSAREHSDGIEKLYVREYPIVRKIIRKAR